MSEAPRSVDEIDAENGDWNHLLPDEDWAVAVAEADRIYQEREAAEGLGGGAEYQPLGLTPKRVSFPDTWKKTSGPIVRNQLWVNHTAECPLRVGFAQSLTQWGNGGYQPRASWPLFVDPATVVTWVSFSRAAFLHGPANSLGWGWEQAGYARFTRAEWLTPDGLRQMDLLAQEIVKRGIPVDALRWLTNAQVRAIVERRDTTTRGLCDHRQIDPKNRSDAGDGYPRDVLLSFIKAYHPGVTTSTPPKTPGTYRIGDRGPEVKNIQVTLDALGYAVGTPDGVAGPLFDSAVRAYQKDSNLDVDGVVGKNTLTRMEEDMATLKSIEDKIDAIWKTPVKRGGEMIPALQELADVKSLVLALAADQAALRAELAAQPDGHVLTAEQIRAAIDEALAGQTATVTLNPKEA